MTIRTLDVMEALHANGMNAPKQNRQLKMTRQAVVGLVPWRVTGRKGKHD